MRGPSGGAFMGTNARLAIYAVFSVALVFSGPLSAEPSSADIALAQTYVERDFGVPRVLAEEKLAKDFGTQKYYALADGIRMWVFPSGYVIIQTQENVTVSLSHTGVKDYQYAAGKEASRSLSLPSGRNVVKEAGKDLAWGLAMEPVPDFSLPVLSQAGKQLRISELRGSPVLIDFWASWCQPCMESLPETNALSKKYAGRGLKVLGVNIEGDVAKAEKAAQGLKLAFPILMAEPDAAGAFNWKARQMTEYRITSIPYMVLVGRDGTVRKAGRVTEADILEAMK